MIKSNEIQMENTSPTKTKRSNRLPTKEEDLKNLAKKVLIAWKNSQLILRWKSPEDFERDVLSFETILTQKAIKSGGQRPVTLELKKLDKEINQAVSYIKNCLVYHHGSTEAKSWYDAYGIKKFGNNYKFPVDRDDRLKSIRLMINAIQHQEVKPDQYQLEFWHNILSQYENCLQKTTQSKGEISNRVGLKNQLKAEIRKVLICLGKLMIIRFLNTPWSCSTGDEKNLQALEC